MRTPLALLLGMLVSLVAVPVASAADPLRGEQWGLDMIESDAARASTSGAGAIVAVIDTGVLPSHEDLKTQLVAGYDFVDDDAIPQDGDGHGTHVTGIVNAAAGNGVGVESVAPGAKVMPIRVLNDDGEGTGAGVAKGIDFAVANKADVINLSLGGNAVSVVLGGDEKFAAALNRAVKAGVIVIAASGNDSLPICEQPMTEGKLLCVGAVDRRSQRSFFSSSGNIVAPGGSAMPVQGEDILSTFNDGKYTEIAGTSQAAPHVAGVAALLVTLGVRGQAAVDRILATTKDLGAAGPDDVYGNGLVNARQAVAGLKPPPGGPGPGGTGGGATPDGRTGFSYRRVQKIATVRRNGVRVRCRAPKAGTCTVRVRARGKTIAKGSRRLKAGRAAFVSARVTPAGHKLLRRAKRQRASLSVNVAGKRFKRTVTLVR